MDSDIEKEIKYFLKLCGIEDESFYERCRILYKYLIAENKKYNLTRIVDEEQFWVKHVCDSAAIFLANRAYFSMGKIICDIGSGAGFPALIIGMGSDCEVYAVESSRKKAEFILKMVKLLELKNVHILNLRAEELSKLDENICKYDVITARAVGKIYEIYRVSHRMLKDSGIYLLYKTPRGIEAELCEIRKRIKKMDWMLQESFNLPCGGGERVFVLGKKVLGELPL